MEWLTVQFYRSLLSDAANYIVTDCEIEQSIAEVQQGFISLQENIARDERYALAVL